MAIHKEKFIDKLIKKDYNNDLEEVLAKKNFKEEVKNLLLDILYKIDDAYKDYETVKKNVLSKEEYMENYINSIKENCESIEFVRPDNSEKDMFVIDKRNKKIVCYPMARKLLYAIAKIKKNENIVKQDTEILSQTLTNAINVGNNINTVEPLRDFNGFAWSVVTSEIENIYYNLIYQDLILLCDNKLMEEWANKNDKIVDYIEIFKYNLDVKYGKKLCKEIFDFVILISILLELSTDKNFKNEFLERKKESEIEVAQMENRARYLDELTKNKKDIEKQIKYIDIMLNDKDILTKEYKKRNKNLPIEEKIFSKRVLALKLIEEREDLFIKLQTYNDKMNSKNFLQRQKRLKEELKYLELIDTKNIEKVIIEKILLLQKRVLNAIKVKIKEAKTREEITKIIYEIRYLSFVPITVNNNVGQVPKLKKLFLEVETEAIAKAYELKTFKDICKDSSLNINILKYIFNLRIIKLEDIHIKLFNETNGTFVQFYDDEITDEKFKIDYEIKNKDLKIKFNKRIRLFDL